VGAQTRPALTKERQRVVTSNDDTNAWMVSVNEDLGFRIAQLCPANQRKL
jgi:hypothetical protein